MVRNRIRPNRSRGRICIRFPNRAPAQDSGRVNTKTIRARDTSTDGSTKEFPQKNGILSVVDATYITHGGVKNMLHVWKGGKCTEGMENKAWRARSDASGFAKRTQQWSMSSLNWKQASHNRCGSLGKSCTLWKFNASAAADVLMCTCYISDP